MRDVGPDAPTLCEGWTARDLAAHLVIRERRPDAAPGILIPALASYTAKVQAEVTRSDSWDDLLAKIASGPPLYSPLKLLDAVANVHEMFIHLEDVRRAQPQWEPRALDDATSRALRSPLKLMARAALSKVPVMVILRTPAGETLATVGNGPPVTVTGEPAELLLFSVGRAARVALEGDDAAVESLRTAPKGL